MKSKYVIMALALMIVAANVFGGDNKRGEAGFMFLKVPMGARETALGMSGLTTSSGASAIYWNPANISASDRPSLEFSYVNHFAGISSNYGAAAFPVSDIGVIGFSFNYLSYGTIDATTELTPEGGGNTYSPFEIALGVSFSKQITDRVSGGLTIKSVTSKIDKVQASGFAFDFGFTYNTGFRGLKMGFAITNLGPQATYEGTGLVRNAVIEPNATDPTAALRFGSEPFEMPSSVNFGASMDLYRNEQNSIVGLLEQNVNSFQANRTNLGVEYGFKNMFFVRGGYTSALKAGRDYHTGKNSTAGLTLGGGVDYKFTETMGVSVDYGYLNMGALDATHRFTVGFRF